MSHWGNLAALKQVLGGTFVRDRTSGRALLALTNMNEVSGAELILIDLDSGKVKCSVLRRALERGMCGR